LSIGTSSPCLKKHQRKKVEECKEEKRGVKAGSLLRLTNITPNGNGGGQVQEIGEKTTQGNQREKKCRRENVENKVQRGQS